jgi:hypothetical protein
MLCGRRRIKPIQRSISMGMTQIQHVTEGMCRQCAWEKIKLKCKICGEIIGKGFPRLLAHAAVHYASSELLYNEEAEENIFLINFESSKTINERFGQDDSYDYTLKCKVCGDSFMFKKEDAMFSKLIDHIKSHYTDKDLVKKQWIAKEMIHINYDSVIQVNTSDSHTDNSSSISSVTYRELTKRERDAYSDALYRIKTEESITKNKRR